MKKIEDILWKECQDCSFYNTEKMVCKASYFVTLPSLKCLLVGLCDLLTLSVQVQGGIEDDS